MRSLTSTLLAAQRGSTGTPFIRLRLTHGGTTYTYKTSDATNRILSIDHEQTAYRGRATIRLQNSDQHFKTKDLQGFKIEPGYGYVTGAGEEYSNDPPLWVESQRIVSIEGGLVCELECVDSWWKLANHRGMGESFSQPPRWDEDTTIKNIISSLLSDVGMGFSDDTGGQDSYINIQPLYEAEVNRPLRNIFRDLLAMTKSMLRWDAGNNRFSLIYLHPSPGVDYTYDTAHSFFSDVKEAAPVVPNRVVVVDLVPTSVLERTSYNGSASDSDSYNAFGTYFTIVIPDSTVQSNADCNQRADAYLHRLKTERNQGRIAVPMNCGQELFDYVQVQDSRSGQTYAGRVGSLRRTYNPAEGEYRTTVVLGGVTGVDISNPMTAMDDLAGLNLMPEGFGNFGGGGLAATNSPLAPALTPYRSNLKFYPGTTGGSNRHNSVHWTSGGEGSSVNGTLAFSDGSTVTLSAGQLTGASQLTFIYFDLASASPSVLKSTTNYDNVLGTHVGLLCCFDPKASGDGFIWGRNVNSFNVVSDVLAAGAVLSAKIADGAVVNTKVAELAISTGKLANLCVDVNKLGPNAVIAEKIAAGAVIADKIAANAVVSDKIATNAVIADKIAANSITSSKIAAGNILANHIAANQVEAYHINVSHLSAISANCGTLTAGFINGVTIWAGGGNVQLDGSGVRVYGQYLKFYSGGDYAGTVYAVGVNLTVTSAWDLRLAAQGNILCINTIRPSSGSVWDCGSAATPWNWVWADNYGEVTSKLTGRPNCMAELRSLHFAPDGKYDYPTLPTRARASEAGLNIGGMVITLTGGIKQIIDEIDSIKERLNDAGI